MPSSLPARCTDPLCGRIATHRGRCEEHQRKAWENPSANTRELTRAEQQRFHDAVFARSDRCAVCGEAATEADHIIAVSANGSAHDAAANGQALCSLHHREKSLDERRQSRRGTDAGSDRSDPSRNQRPRNLAYVNGLQDRFGHGRAV